MSGITVDELVTVVKYEMDAHSKAILEQQEKLTQKAVAGVRDQDKASRTAMRSVGKFTKSLDIQSKAVRAAGAVTGRLVDLVKGLGITSGIASGIMAGWGINAAKGATELKKLSFSTGLSTEELQSMGSAYSQLGSSLEVFAQDAANYRNQTGFTLTLDRIKNISKDLAGMTERDALNVGRSIGLSDDSVRIWRESATEMERLYNGAKAASQVNTQEQLNKLNILAGKWAATQKTANVAATALSAGMAPGLSRALDSISASLSSNQDSFESWGTSFGDVLGNLVDGAVGKISELNKRVEEINSPEAINIMQSDDPEARKAEIERREQIARYQSYGNKLGLLAGLGRAVFTDSTISGEIETYRQADARINLPVETAKHFDQLKARGQESFWVDAATKGILDLWRKDMMRNDFRRFDRLTNMGMDPVADLKGKASALAERFAREGLILEQDRQKALIRENSPWYEPDINVPGILFPDGNRMGRDRFAPSATPIRNPGNARMNAKSFEPQRERVPSPPQAQTNGEGAGSGAPAAGGVSRSNRLTNNTTNNTFYQMAPFASAIEQIYQSLGNTGAGSAKR